MGRTMIANIDEIVDFQKLRNSNSLGHKWSKKFQVHSTRYIRFIIDLKNNLPNYLSLLEDEEDRQELLKDHPHMFYAVEVENFLVEQFYNAIISVLKRLGVDKRNYEDFISHGFLAIRSSAWMYRLSTTKFSSFAYNGIYNRILGLVSRKSHKEKAKQKRVVHLVNLSDLYGDENDGQDWYEESSKIDSAETNFDEQPLCMEEIIKSAGLSEEEQLLLEYFVMKSKGVAGWNRLYREEVLKRTGQNLSKQGVAWRLQHIQGKIAKAIKMLKGEEFSLPLAISA